MGRSVRWLFPPRSLGGFRRGLRAWATHKLPLHRRRPNLARLRRASPSLGLLLAPVLVLSLPVQLVLPLGHTRLQRA